jgi:hypothetical protein
MKKVLFVLALGAFAACGTSEAPVETPVLNADSLAKVAADSLAAVTTDSLAKISADSLAKATADSLAKAATK